MAPVAALLLLLLGLLPPSHSQIPSPNYSWCAFSSASNYTANGTFHSNLLALLSNLSSSATGASGFLTATSGSAPDRTYGLALCRGDASAYYCRTCLSFAAADIPQLCPGRKSAAVWYDLCFLRYSDTAFATSMDYQKQVYMRNSAKVPAADSAAFNRSIVSVLDRLRARAVTDAADPALFVAGKMSTGEIGGYGELYGMVQCTRDITAEDCDRCLKGIFRNLGDCCPGPAIGGRVLSANCYFRYESGAFYNWSRELVLQPLDAAPPAETALPPGGAAAPSTPAVGSGNDANSTKSGEKKNETTIVLATVIPLSIVGLLVIITCIYFQKNKIKKAKRDNKLHDVVSFESLLVDLSTIKLATNNFSESNKLGEGGFGLVYKGVLSDGQEIAVKRIVRQSPHGIEQLKNEVVLLAKLQHRNLVRILGVCFEGDERMLIYEYLANKSMDTVLFDRIKKQQLNWVIRFKIIMGIARGLQYLHEESQITIIHRDLKASNILLDGQLEPKISDFGTARLFGDDQTQACTNNVVGTFGYMPPEYIIRGQFSNKTDVFSFGILLLEIVTGRRNRDFLTSQNEQSRDLLSFVWEHWLNKSTSEIVDSALMGNYSQDEVLLCIQIGLLCVQELPASRPAMSSIVLMLNSHTTSLQIQAPVRPAFIRNLTLLARNASRQPEVYTQNDASVTELEPR